MGNLLSGFKQCLRCSEKDILTENSLEAVREIITVLRNVRFPGNRWLLQVGDGLAHQGIVNEIVVCIENGSVRTVRNMLDAGWRLEASHALYVYLTRLKKSLIPEHIQSLALDNDNGNISPEVVAGDILGLIQDNLTSRHKTFLGLLLQLMDNNIKLSPADELRGRTLPVSMLPLFFNIENYHFMHEWRRILAIFVELIKQGPVALLGRENRSELFM
ncbi:uncharacterized protein LOC126746385 [Anthonomus grandis grandis]|uniref:uncharacterized protein LOC126746385 n=1 Tax=Anthonomus grandis grandis TaxID=2921223 RepID=UPI002164FB02|nr:uncharacterized protein LOC126746385 [Anthonomus grandis grandis]